MINGIEIRCLYSAVVVGLVADSRLMGGREREEKREREREGERGIDNNKERERNRESERETRASPLSPSFSLSLSLSLSPLSLSPLSLSSPRLCCLPHSGTNSSDACLSAAVAAREGSAADTTAARATRTPCVGILGVCLIPLLFPEIYPSIPARHRVVPLFRN